jgi:hypothetical protein
MPTKDECRKAIFKIAIQEGVSPNLIATRLLSGDDKADMMNGLLGTDSLVTGVRVWVNAGMPDYANGHTEPYRPKDGKPMQRYRGMGLDA